MAFFKCFHCLRLCIPHQHKSKCWNTSLIKLALVSNTALLLHCSTVPPLLNSDHNGLKWKHNDQQQPRTIWRHRNADYRKACQLIDETDWGSLLSAEDVDLVATNWHNKFMDIMTLCIPQQTLRRRRNAPWLTKNITRHIRKRNAAFQATKKSARPKVASKYERLHNKVVKMLRHAKTSYFK